VRRGVAQWTAAPGGNTGRQPTRTDARSAAHDPEFHAEHADASGIACRPPRSTGHTAHPGGGHDGFAERPARALRVRRALAADRGRALSEGRGGNERRRLARAHGAGTGSSCRRGFRLPHADLAGTKVATAPTISNRGYQLDLALAPGEKLIGFGDQVRTLFSPSTPKTRSGSATRPITPGLRYRRRDGLLFIPFAT